MALTLDIAANTRAAVRSVGDVGDALSNVADALDDVAREAQQNGRRVETALDGAGDAGKDMARDIDAAGRRAERALDSTGDAGRDMGRDIDAAGDRVERTFDQLVRDAKRADRAVADVGDGGTKSLGKVKASAQEVQQEFGQNLAESVSSVRGDLTELGQVGQDTLGGLAGTVAGMGPAGLAGAFALAAGAVGLGALTAGQEEAREKQEEVNAAAARFADMYASGINGAIDSAQVFAEINSIATDPERYKAAGENAKNWGVDVQTAMRAMAGDMTAIGTVDAALDRQEEALRRNAEGADNYAQSIEQATTGQSQANGTYLAGRDALDELTGSMDLGKQSADNAARAQFEYAQSVGIATGKTDDLGNAIVRLPDGKEVVMNADTKQANTDVDAFENNVRNVADKTVTARLIVDDRDLRNYRPPIITVPGQIVPRGTVAVY